MRTLFHSFLARLFHVCGYTLFDGGFEWVLVSRSPHNSIFLSYFDGYVPTRDGEASDVYVILYVGVRQFCLYHHRLRIHEYDSTCCGCPELGCEYRGDAYNQHGDCLASK